MNKKTPFQPGDILIDRLFALIADDFIHNGTEKVRDSPILQHQYINSVAQLVESIVIHDRLIIPEVISPLPHNWMLLRNLSQSLIRRGVRTEAEVGYESVRKILPVEYKHVEDSIERPYDLEEERIIMYRKGRPPCIMGKGSFIDEIRQVSLLTRDISYVYGLALRSPINGLNDRYTDIAVNTFHKIEDAIEEENSVTNAYISGFYRLDMPLVFNYIINRAKSRSEIIPLAMDLRNTKEAVAFRQQLTLLDDSVSVDDRKRVTEITREIDDKIKSLRNKLKQRSTGLSIAFPYQVGIDVDKIISLVLKPIERRRKRHLVFLEQLYDVGVQSRGIRRNLGKLL